MATMDMGRMEGKQECKSAHRRASRGGEENSHKEITCCLSIYAVVRHGFLRLQPMGCRKIRNNLNGQISKKRCNGDTSSMV